MGVRGGRAAGGGVARASGSEAPRGVAPLVWCDSNFSALPAVVAEGRRVINNIGRVASLFLAKTTYSIVLSVPTAVFAFAYPPPPERWRSLKRVVEASHLSLTTPVGPLRCLAMMSSATPTLSAFSGSFDHPASLTW